MSIQIIKDTSGADAFVVIPMVEWKAPQERLAEKDTGRPVESFGLTVAQALETRARLGCFAPDWEAPEMDAYDRYDEARKNLETR